MEKAGPLPLGGAASIREGTQGFDTISESARRPRGKGAFIPHLRGAREGPATKALVSVVKWWGCPQTTRELWKSTGSSDGGVCCQGSNGSEEALAASGSFRGGGLGLAGGRGDPGLEGQFRKMKPMLGKRGFIRLTGQKAEPVGLKWTLFLSGQEVRKATSGPGDLEDGERNAQIYTCVCTHARTRVRAHSEQKRNHQRPGSREAGSLLKQDGNLTKKTKGY